MRHRCSNRLAFAFSTSIWRGLNLSVSYLLWRDIFKKCCHAKAFKIQNDPTRSASLINLFGLGRVVHFGAGGVTRTPDLLITKSIGALHLTVFRDFGAFPLGILREVRPILSTVFVRSFTRVGHGVGQKSMRRAPSQMQRYKQRVFLPILLSYSALLKTC